jgi:hypothetical protein
VDCAWVWEVTGCDEGVGDVFVPLCEGGFRDDGVSESNVELLDNYFFV